MAFWARFIMLAFKRCSDFFRLHQLATRPRDRPGFGAFCVVPPAQVERSASQIQIWHAQGRNVCCHFILTHLVGMRVPVATHTVVHHCTGCTQQTELSHCPTQFINFLGFSFCCCCMASSQQRLSLQTPLEDEAPKQSHVLWYAALTLQPAALTRINVNATIAPSDQCGGAGFNTTKTRSLAGFPSVNTATCVCQIRTTKPEVAGVGDWARVSAVVASVLPLCHLFPQRHL